MSEKVTDYIEVTSLPTDTLFDASIDTSTTPKTRSISKANLAGALGVFYNSDGVISDAIRKVDLDTNSLHFEKGRIGFGSTVASSGSESYLFKPLNVGEAVVRVMGGVTGSDEYFVVDDGGFVGVGETTQFSNEKLRVGGNAHVNGVMSIGGAPLNGGQLNLPAGFVLNFNNQSSLTDDSTNNYLSLRCRSDKRVLKAADNTFVFEETYIDSMESYKNLISEDATAGNQSNKTKNTLTAKYWDGAATQSKAFDTLVTPTALTGVTEVSQSIDGTDILILKDSGVLNTPNMPTSSAGLVAGDLYMATAADILSNGDLVMGVKQ